MFLKFGSSQGRSSRKDDGLWSVQVDFELKEMGLRGNLEVRSESSVGQELKMAEDKLEK